MIIAVDGPTASGKGTIAKALAAHFALPHLDTGLLYRAVGRQVELAGGDPDDAAAALAACDFADELLTDPALRSKIVGGLASRVSIHPAVRKALFDRQRAFATQPGGAVLDGRDIATVVARVAAAEVFLDRSQRHRFAAFAHFGEAALGAGGDAGGDEQLHLGLGRDDGADVAPVEHRAARLGGEGALAFEQRLTHGGMD